MVTGYWYGGYYGGYYGMVEVRSTVECEARLWSMAVYGG